MNDIIFKFDVGDMAYYPVPSERRKVCSQTRFKSHPVTMLMHVKGLNYYEVGGEWIEESFLLTEEEYGDVALLLTEEERDCLQQKLDDLG